MKIFACLIWYDENPRWLAQAVASYSRLADHVIAVDGAYFHYPQGRPSSGGEQAATIQAVATAHGMGCTIHTPETVWMGNEPEKRNSYVRIAEAIGTPMEDWLLVLDGDEEISYVSGFTRRDLAETELHAADIWFWTTDEIHSWFGQTRRMYRLLHEMEYGPTHYTIRGWTADLYSHEWAGERVCINGRGSEYGETMEPALDLTAQVKVEHKHHLRSASREASAREFNRLRVDLDLEDWASR